MASSPPRDALTLVFTAIDAEGLFRVSGAVREVEELLKQFEKGTAALAAAPWSSITHPCSPNQRQEGRSVENQGPARCSRCNESLGAPRDGIPFIVLTERLQLRELSDPLLTFELYDCFVATASAKL